MDLISSGIKSGEMMIFMAKSNVGKSKITDLIRTRIEIKGINAEDIKHPGRLSQTEIASIKPELVYMWIHSRQWKQRDFLKWVKAIGEV